MKSFLIYLYITLTTIACQEQSLTVIRGEGSGSYYPGTLVDISANSPLKEERFYKWNSTINDPQIIERIEDIYSSKTTFNMWVRAVTLEPEYIPSSENHLLTVKDGMGTGRYYPGEIIRVAAKQPDSQNLKFKNWQGDTSGLSSLVTNPKNMRMPRKDVELTAVFDTPFTLTVINGNGGGKYFSGDSVQIKADPAENGKKFERWIGDIDYLENPEREFQTFEMAEANINLEATYTNKDISYSCKPIGNGTDDGFFSLEVFNGKLYAGGFGYNMKPMLFRYPNWEIVSPGINESESLCELREFNGYLYANTESQGKLYRSKDGTSWNQVLDDSGTIGCVLREFKGQLYATTYELTPTTRRSGRIYRSSNGTNWEKVFDSGSSDIYMKEIIEYQNTLYAFSINSTTGVGGYYTSTNGTNWQWHHIGALRLFKGHVWNNELYASSSAMYSAGGESGIWKFNGTNFVNLANFPGNSHVGEILDYKNNLFATVTVQWKGSQGGASLIMSENGGTKWKEICRFPETESWNLAEYNGDLFISTKQHGGRGDLGRVYKLIEE